MKLSEQWGQPPVVWLLVTLGVMFIFRMGIWIAYGSNEALFLQPDSHDYRYLGQQLFENGVFPSFSRTPTYPLFLGFNETILGLSIQGVIFIQIVISLITGYLAWRLLMICSNGSNEKEKAELDRYGYVVFLLVFGLDFISAQGVNYVLSETLFTLLILLGINLAIETKYGVRGGWINALLCGLVLGAAILCRPIAIFLPLAFLVWGVFSIPVRGAERGRDPATSKRIIRFVLVFAIASSFTVGWMVRNQEKTGVTFLTTISSINLYEYRAAWNVAHRDGRTFESVQQEFREKKNTIRREQHLNEGQLSKVMGTEGLRLIKETPLETFYQGGLGLLRLYFGVFSSAIQDLWEVMGLSSGSVVLKGLVFLHGLFIYIGVLGLIPNILSHRRKYGAVNKGVDRNIAGVQKKYSTLILCVFVIGYFTLFSVGVEAYARFRIPLMPLLGIISVLGWAKILTVLFRKKHDLTVQNIC